MRGAAASIVAAGAFEVVVSVVEVEASEVAVVDAPEVAAVVAGKCCES